MPSISLRRLIGKQKETRELFGNILHLASDRIGIVDDQENLIYGVTISEPKYRIPVEVNGEVLGWVSGGEQAHTLAGIIRHFALKESERKTLGQEVLTMYREINVIYDFSEKLAQAIEPEAIARLALEEAGHLIESNGNCVILNMREDDSRAMLITQQEHDYSLFQAFKGPDSPFGKLDTVEGAEIINDLENDPRFREFSDEIVSLIFAPLKVKQRVLGLMVLVSETQVSYKAADLKILTTLGLMAASAIESSLLYKKVLEEAKSREETLKKIDKLKDEFLANTSHELRTPLNGIIGLSESLYDRIGNGDQKEDLAMIISSGKRLANLVNDILDFSKLKNYDITIQRKPVDLQSLVNVVLRINGPLLSGKPIELNNRIPADFVHADGDENRLQQILNNLIGNAIKFTESGYIDVHASLKGKTITVAVADSGIGIPEDKRMLIFEEFQQADGSVGRSYSGTGLGLSISRHLVELHGGRIWVEPNEGQGSVFKFTLKMSDQKAGKELVNLSLSRVSGVSLPDKKDTGEHPTDEGAGIEKDLGQAVNILIVDDEPINHRVLKNHLSSAGYRITRALNGEEALKALDNGIHYNLVLLDVMMPRMTGYEVCQKIREKYMPSELPVIMVTAKNQLQDLVQGFHLGANDYLAKPFSKQEFLARINTQLDLNRIFDVTGRFVPNEFIRSLGKDRITEVILGDQAHREVSVLFTDIRGYTSLSEGMTPEENFNFINAFNQRLGPAIQENHGFINQYLGDAIMALFTRSPQDGLNAAIAIQKILQDYNLSRREKGRRPIRVGIGLHTGPLIMGITGDSKRMDAAIISDTVNTASRIESLSKYYKANILLSEATLEGLGSRDDYHFRFLGKVKVKGKNIALNLYECFDGDEPAIFRHKLDTRALFDQGVNALVSRQFKEAVEAFSGVIGHHISDPVASLFHERSLAYNEKGVPEDWEGIEVIPFK